MCATSILQDQNLFRDIEAFSSSVIYAFRRAVFLKPLKNIYKENLELIIKRMRVFVYFRLYTQMTKMRFVTDFKFDFLKTDQSHARLCLLFVLTETPNIVMCRDVSRIKQCPISPLSDLKH